MMMFDVDVFTPHHAALLSAVRSGSTYWTRAAAVRTPADSPCPAELPCSSVAAAAVS